MKKFIISILIASGVIYLALSVVWIRSHGWNRPYISWEIRELASYLAEHNLSPRGCLDLVWFEIGLSQTEARAECVYHYAKLTKDPSACELLMPSSYGLSCVGAASESPICGINSGFEVQWHEGEDDEVQRSSLKDCQKKGGRTKKGDQCCVIASVSGIRSFNDCSALANDIPLLDTCLKQLAFKNHDPASCETIQDVRIKAGCIVNAKALRQDPSICSKCTQPLNDLSELK